MSNNDVTPIWQNLIGLNTFKSNAIIFGAVACLVMINQSREIKKLKRDIEKMKERE